jgi:hypothetical protein
MLIVDDVVSVGFSVVGLWRKETRKYEYVRTYRRGRRHNLSSSFSQKVRLIR